MTELDQGRLAIDVLMPKFSNQEMFRIRYSGLVEKLGEKGVLAYFAFDHATYNAQEHRFTEQTTMAGDTVGDNHIPSVVRNLTMTYESKPIYNDPQAPQLVHDTDFNRFISRKDRVAELLPEVHPITIVADIADLSEAAAAIPGYRVIIKPITGLRSEGVQVVRKKELKSVEGQGSYLVQEFIDTSQGDQLLGIEGKHNLRLLSVDSELVGAIARVGGDRQLILRNDQYGRVFAPEDLPADAHSVADRVHQKLRGLPGDGKNVIAIDLMRGRSKAREIGYVVCEINEKPLRISPYTLRNRRHQDTAGILWLGQEWDRTEAQLLTGLVAGKAGKQL